MLRERRLDLFDRVVVPFVQHHRCGVFQNSHDRPVLIQIARCVPRRRVMKPSKNAATCLCFTLATSAFSVSSKAREETRTTKPSDMCHPIAAAGASRLRPDAPFANIPLARLRVNFTGAWIASRQPPSPLSMPARLYCLYSLVNKLCEELRINHKSSPFIVEDRGRLRRYDVFEGFPL